MPDEPTKDDVPQTTLTAMAIGLSIKREDGISFLDRFGPASALIVHITVLGLMMFDLVPNLQVAALVLGLTGPIAAAWAAKLGAVPKPG